jgi:hypothetical protein
MERARGDIALKSHREELKHLRQIITDLNNRLSLGGL